MHCSCIVKLVNVWYEPALHGWVVGTEVPAGQKYLRREEEEKGGKRRERGGREEGERRERIRAHLCEYVKPPHTA